MSAAEPTNHPRPPNMPGGVGCAPLATKSFVFGGRRNRHRVRGVVGGFTQTFSSPGSTVVLPRDGHLTAKSNEPAEIPANSLHGTLDQVGVSPGGVGVSV